MKKRERKEREKETHACLRREWHSFQDGVSPCCSRYAIMLGQVDAHVCNLVIYPYVRLCLYRCITLIYSTRSLLEVSCQRISREQCDRATKSVTLLYGITLLDLLELRFSFSFFPSFLPTFSYLPLDLPFIFGSYKLSLSLNPRVIRDLSWCIRLIHSICPRFPFIFAFKLMILLFLSFFFFDWGKKFINFFIVWKMFHSSYIGNY